MNWYDLQLFLAVVRGSGLAGAAAQSGVSPATLSRRMASIERSLGKRLFVRGRRGYGVTPAGQALFERAAAMELAASDIEQWQKGATQARRVRISAGTWTAQLLADNLGRFWSPEEAWVPELITQAAKVDIARREADIGIRNRRPDAPWLAGRLIATNDYAVYCATKPRIPNPPKEPAWIGIAGDSVLTPTARWMAEGHGLETLTTVNDPRLALSLVRQGLGRMVLPCFVGDAAEDLTRVGEAIPELRSEEWLVMHQDERHYPPVRSAIDALAKFLRHKDQGPAPSTPEKP
ncbi:LysR family transcriptional regulator [Pelagibius litoralis]|nr:LysR family transcriptional regulator [Pelagibius litoralis]